MSLRIKLLIPFVLVACAVLPVLLFYWEPHYERILEEEYREATERHLASVAEGLVPLLLAHQLDAVYENLSALKQRNDNWADVSLTGPAGNTIYPLIPKAPAAGRRGLFPIRQILRYKDEDLGRLTVQVDFEKPLAGIKQAYRRLLTWAFFVLLLGMAAIWFLLQRTVSSPVMRLAEASKMLARGNFDAPLPPDSLDEIGELVGSFKAMRSSIRSYQTELLDRAESLAKLSHAVEQSPVSIVIADRQGRIEFVNPRFTSVTGYAAGDVLGKDLHIIRSEEEGVPQFEEIWKVAAAGGSWHGEFRSVKKNGDVIWQSASLSPILDEQGDMTHAVALLEDVTERRALEAQLRQSQKMEAVGLLTGGIAHDFNNILAAIIGYGSILRLKLPAGEQLRSYVDEILHASERAATLVKSLLAFSRKGVVVPRLVDVNELVNRMEKMLLRLIREDIELKTLFHRTRMVITIDPGQLEQVLINLVTNARDALPAGGKIVIETRKVELDEDFRKKHGYGEEGQYVLLSVSDTGIGMDRKTQERIFEPFFTTKEQGKGTGLGLSTVYGIVKQSKGYISCYSEPNRGTTFNIYFPLVPTGEEESPVLQAPVIMTGSEMLLVAEDNDTVRAYTRSVLEEAGYRVVTAVDGEDAVARFLERPDDFDLLLLDVIMPKMSGREVYDRLRAVRPGIKALFTSGYTADLVEEKGILSGELAFISKPCTPFELLQKIRTVLNGAGPAADAGVKEHADHADGGRKV